MLIIIMHQYLKHLHSAAASGQHFPKKTNKQTNNITYQIFQYWFSSQSVVQTDLISIHQLDGEGYRLLGLG